MAYQGNTPALNYISFAKQTFSIVNGQTSYTLNNSVANGLDILLYINNVKQVEGSGNAYTASGNTLTIASALTSGSDEMYCLFIGKAVQSVVPPSGSVTNAMLGETITVAKGGTGLTSGFANGITMADQWRLTSTKTDNSDITANLERNDNADYGSIGTGMTESSGIFTFPSTGIYLVITQSYWKGNSGGATSAGVYTLFTQDNSTYTTQAHSYCSFPSNNTYGNTFVGVLVDVTDTSLCKIKFLRDSNTTNAELRGSTTQTLTGFTFLRLGDT